MSEDAKFILGFGCPKPAGRWSILELSRGNGISPRRGCRLAAEPTHPAPTFSRGTVSTAAPTAPTEVQPGGAAVYTPERTDRHRPLG